MEFKRKDVLYETPSIMAREEILYKCRYMQDITHGKGSQ